MENKNKHSTTIFEKTMRAINEQNVFDLALNFHVSIGTVEKWRSLEETPSEDLQVQIIKFLINKTKG